MATATQKETISPKNECTCSKEHATYRLLLSKAGADHDIICRVFEIPRKRQVDVQV